MTGGHSRAGELWLPRGHHQSGHDRLYLLDRPARGQDVPADAHRAGVARATVDRGFNFRFQQPFLPYGLDRTHGEIRDSRRGYHKREPFTRAGDEPAPGCAGTDKQIATTSRQRIRT